MTSEVVERVKLALIAAEDVTGGSRDLEFWDRLSRAAIVALREPTQAMTDRARTPSAWPSFEEFWRAMIDTALEDK